MFFKRFILFVACLVGIGIFYKTDFCTHWLDVYIFPESNPIDTQFQHTSLEERRAFRFGNTYSLLHFIQKTLDTTHVNNGEPIILLPPNDYLKDNGVTAFHLPEPAEIYYHSGLKTVWTTSPDVQKANWAVLLTGKGNITFQPIQSKEQLQSLLDMYKKYKPSL